MGFRSVELSSSVLSSLVAQRRRERRGSGHLLLRRGSSIPGRIAHGGNTAQYERLTKVTGLRCKIDVGTYLPTAGPMFDTSPPPTYLHGLPIGREQTPYPARSPIPVATAGC